MTPNAPGLWWGRYKGHGALWQWWRVWLGEDGTAWARPDTPSASGYRLGFIEWDPHVPPMLLPPSEIHRP